MTAEGVAATTPTDEVEGVGAAAYKYFTDPVGLEFATAVPEGRADVIEFIAERARHDGVSTDDLRVQVEAVGYAHFVLDCLRAGHLTSTAAANLLGVHYHDFYRMAYSTQALTMPASLLASLLGRVDTAIEQARQTPGLVVQQIEYSSSMEELSPLYAEIAYDPTRHPAPVMILQHGDYPGSRLGAVPGIVELARIGFFALAVSKRGRDGSAGPGDSWCRETLDIHDALTYCLREYAAHCDAGNIAIMGQSGGGMDTIACVARFPDTFTCAVDIAGTLDVAGLIRSVGSTPTIDNAGDSAENYADANRAFYQLLSKDMGGEPDDVPDRTLARDVSACGMNNPYTKTLFVWDEEDGGASLYEPGTRRYLDDQARHGYVNSELVISRVGDPIRFFHWVHPDQTILRHRFIPQLLSGSYPTPVLSSAGRMVIPGFVRTKRFTVWLGSGDDAVARLEYQLAGDTGEFRFCRLSSNPRARGRLILHRADGTDREVEFGLDDTVRT